MNDAFESHLAQTARIGPPAPGSFTGAAGGAACGDLVRLSVEIDGGRIESISLDTEGCGAMRAAANAAAELAEGASVIDAAAIGAADIDAALGGLTPGKLHAPGLAADALHRALAAASGSGATLAEPDSRRVLVALSGGVDSAVAALLERERGAEVVAVTLKLWADPETDGTRACCSPEAVLGARALSHSLGIPHLTLDLEDEFRRRVVSGFVAGYSRGETPNPCVLCNGEVRIAAMVALADRIGATSLVTGHYARLLADESGPLLAPAADEAKDQSYMLAALPPEILARLRFPLAQMTKPEVREAARRHGLAVARKPESQDLCFLAGGASAPSSDATAVSRTTMGRSSTAAAGPSAATAATTTSPSASAAASASPRPSPSTCSRPTPPQTPSPSDPGPSSSHPRSGCATPCSTVTGRGSTPSGCATTRRWSPPGCRGRPGPGTTRPFGSRWASRSRGPLRGRPRS